MKLKNKMKLKEIRQKYFWNKKIDKILEIATNKYGLERPDDRELIKAYYEIQAIKSQRFYQYLTIFLTLLLIYVTWKSYSCN